GALLDAAQRGAEAAQEVLVVEHGADHALAGGGVAQVLVGGGEAVLDVLDGLRVAHGGGELGDAADRLLDLDEAAVDPLLHGVDGLVHGRGGLDPAARGDRLAATDGDLDDLIAEHAVLRDGGAAVVPDVDHAVFED